MNRKLTIVADFSGSNILVERIDGDDIYLRQDIRDSTTGWFYWAFRVGGAQGEHLTFHFTGGDVLGVRGPAVSFDNGASWQWLGDDIVSRETAGVVRFSYDFPAQHTKALFAFCPIYTEQNFKQFLAQFEDSAVLHNETLCHSRRGREVELLRIGNTSAKFQLLFTCRHHACEAMASYFLEGLLAAILSQDETGIWFRANVDCAVVPVMDKDGVEAGDQGKNRAPHDHNRDYGGEVSDSIYPEVAALRRWIPTWLRQEKNPVILDFHCPHIRANENEDVYFVGVPSEQVWEEVQKLSTIWEKSTKGSVPFEKCNNLPFGEKWNTGSNYSAGKSFTKWVSEFAGVRLTTAMEMPYANAGGAEVTPESCRDLGRSLATALRIYWEENVVLK